MLTSDEQIILACLVGIGVIAFFISWYTNTLNLLKEQRKTNEILEKMVKENIEP